MTTDHVPVLPLMESVWQETLHWQPNPDQQQIFQHLYDQIREANRQFNLTRITQPEEFWEKHLWDSLRGIFPKYPTTESQPLQVIDIGTGAGFPGLPVAIAHPTWHLTLLDSTRKKIAFINTLLPPLNIPNARAIVGRVEQLGHQTAHRETYDLVLIRAVAAVAVCVEYALPLLKMGGIAILYRGQWTVEEAAALPAIAAQVGGRVQSVESFTTPLTHSIRHCVYVQKAAPTSPLFPRSPGIPVQHPLTH